MVVECVQEGLLHRVGRQPRFGGRAREGLPGPRDLAATPKRSRLPRRPVNQLGCMALAHLDCRRESPMRCGSPAVG